MTRVWKILVSLGLARVTWQWKSCQELYGDCSGTDPVFQAGGKRIYGFKLGRKRTRKAKPRAVKQEQGLPFQGGVEL